MAAHCLPSARALHPYNARILLPLRSKFVFVSAADIERLHSDGNYVVVVAGSTSYAVRSTLAKLLSWLPAGFVRVHKSAAVNASHVVALERRSTSALLVLSSGATVPLGRPFRDDFFAAVGLDAQQ